MPSELLLEFPGQIDLSAYVNFIALAQACGSNPSRTLFSPQSATPSSSRRKTSSKAWASDTAAKYPAVTQLLKQSAPEHGDRLESELVRLTHADEMGEIYKFFFICNKAYGTPR